MEPIDFAECGLEEWLKGSQNRVLTSGQTENCTTEEGTFYPKEHISEDIWKHRQKYQHPSAGDVSPAPKFGGLCDELLETDCNVSEADSLLQPLYW